MLFFGTTEQFGQSTQGTYGAGELGQFAVDADGRFQTTIEVPTRIGSIQGQGGGDVKPGLYAIYSKPDLCRTYVTVR